VTFAAVFTNSQRKPISQHQFRFRKQRETIIVHPTYDFVAERAPTSAGRAFLHHQ
jgi:hypothetical protein